MMSSTIGVGTRFTWGELPCSTCEQPSGVRAMCLPGACRALCMCGGVCSALERPHHHLWSWVGWGGGAGQKGGHMPHSRAQRTWLCSAKVSGCGQRLDCGQVCGTYRVRTNAGASCAKGGAMQGVCSATHVRTRMHGSHGHGEAGAEPSGGHWAHTAVSSRGMCVGLGRRRRESVCRAWRSGECPRTLWTWSSPRWRRLSQFRVFDVCGMRCTGPMCAAGVALGSE